jgi:hypothetical protein
VTYILIKAKPGQNLQDLKQRLNDALPDTQAYTTAEVASSSLDWATVWSADVDSDGWRVSLAVGLQR